MPQDSRLILWSRYFLLRPQTEGSKHGCTCSETTAAKTQLEILTRAGFPAEPQLRALHTAASWATRCSTRLPRTENKRNKTNISTQNNSLALLQNPNDPLAYKPEESGAGSGARLVPQTPPCCPALWDSGCQVWAAAPFPAPPEPTSCVVWSHVPNRAWLPDAMRRP